LREATYGVPGAPAQARLGRHCGRTFGTTDLAFKFLASVNAVAVPRDLSLQAWLRNGSTTGLTQRARFAEG